MKILVGIGIVLLVLAIALVVLGIAASRMDGDD